ncbi:Acetyl esterase/lipase [Actinomadura meyerae]|jgi:acetyl esterase/lipase|uniref:Acetyl esterase/lipase n=1 Tax=Actinomadura meyerae TaxID=240840 RepID=A0A239NTZ8_9ACTN|nr:alpha/beta hydrolase [Actinomadura meyerae]SNT57599.1 Acetyl esterase/lipase [Actinomadura meyerae]
MPYGYLTSLALVAVPTWFALAAPRRPRPLATVAFFLGVAANELPIAALAWVLVATVICFVQGDLTSPVVVGALVVTVAGLGVVAWCGRRALPAVQEAMGAVPVSGRLPSYGRVLLSPLLRRHRAVERVANISYGPEGKRNLLDLYRHRSLPTGAPVLIHLHGGGYKGGRKNSQALPLLRHLAGQGWVCISANYRLLPEANFDDHLADAKRVIAWVREYGRSYGADPDRIFLAGSSAGAHLSAMAAFTADGPDTSVAAVIGLGGYYGPYYTDPQASPIDRVRSDAPPFLIVHGDHDTVTSVEDARLFAERLRAVSGQPVVYAELPGGQHAFDLFDSLRFHAVINAIDAFAERVVTVRATK